MKVTEEGHSQAGGVVLVKPEVFKLTDLRGKEGDVA